MTHTPWLEETVTWLEHVTVSIKMYVCVKSHTVTVLANFIILYFIKAKV